MTYPGATDDDRDDVCTGRGTADGDHCCYVANEVCRYLRVGTDRAWECSLRAQLGSWEAVHEYPGYKAYVQSVWDEVGISSCGDWQPREGQCCREPR